MLHYDPSGGGLLVAAVPGRALVTPAGGDAARVRAAYDAMAGGAEPSAVLDGFVAGSISAAPAFALVSWSDAGEALAVDVVARGSLPVSVVVDGTAEQVDASAATAWIEKSFAAATGVAIGGAVAGGGLPFGSGVVSAAAVAIVPGGGGVPAPAAPAAAATPAVASAPPVAATATPASPAPAAPAAPAETVAAANPGIAPPPSDDDEDDATSYDHLFGETVMQPISAAAVRPVDEAEEDAPAAQPPAAPDPAAPDPAPPAAVPAPAAPVASAAAPNTVSAPPPDGAGAPAPIGETTKAPPTEAEAAAGPEHTVVAADIDALRARRRQQRRGPEPEQAPEPTAFLEASDGKREFIGQGLLLGRAPVLERATGSQIPRLLKVVTPNQELSRTHAEVRLEGGAVVVTDLHSKNGVFVTLPGQSETRLREGEPTPVIPGTLLDLGDGAVYTVGEE